MRYEGENKVLRYFNIVRPQLWDEPDFQKAAFVLHHLAAEGIMAWGDATDALAELIPEQREFWLRVQATWNTQFVEAMTASFEEMQPE